MSARTNQRYFRTDEGIEYYFDGTRWLTTQLFSWEHYSGNTGLAATASPLWRWPVHSGQDIWLVDFHLTWFVASGGTNLDGSNYWVVGLHKRNGVTSTTNVSTRTINFHPTGVYNSAITHAVGTIDALLGATTDWAEYGVAKTGTPGALNVVVKITYRLVGT